MSSELLFSFEEFLRVDNYLLTNLIQLLCKDKQFFFKLNYENIKSVKLCVNALFLLKKENT